MVDDLPDDLVVLHRGRRLSVYSALLTEASSGWADGRTNGQVSNPLKFQSQIS